MSSLKRDWKWTMLNFYCEGGKCIFHLYHWKSWNPPMSDLLRPHILLVSNVRYWPSAPASHTGTIVKSKANNKQLRKSRSCQYSSVRVQTIQSEPKITLDSMPALCLFIFSWLWLRLCVFPHFFTRPAHAEPLDTDIVFVQEKVNIILFARRRLQR